MLIVGITGGIGTGKTTLASLVTELGFPVLDADLISRELTAKDGKAIPSLKENFPPSIFSPDNSLDRAKAADFLFANRQKLDSFSQIIHQEVFKEIQSQLEIYRQNQEKACFLDVPIPVKKGFQDQCHLIITVSASSKSRLNRLSQRGMNEAEAQRRMNSQMTPEEYAEIANYVFTNDKDIPALKKQLLEFLDLEFKTRGIPYPI